MDASHIARMHGEFCRIYTSRINVDQVLKRIMLEVFNNMYNSQLEDYFL
jgi:hypothetical protein